MRVLVAMSGGVDSSVAAALLTGAGHDVTGVTLKLWGGPSDRGCCTVADVDDARRVAARLGIEHHVFNLGDQFDAHVVAPYVAAHAAARTPNPCIECNRHVKFGKLLRRAAVLGFDAVATGHHARVVLRADGTHRVARGVDAVKDQSYVVGVLGQEALRRVLFPVGLHTKDDVRAIASRLGLRTAAKPDSQEVCFITAGGGRTSFLGERLTLHPGRVVDRAGADVGRVDAVELVTIGQRRGLGLSGAAAARYVTEVDLARRTVTVGDRTELLSPTVALEDLTWVSGPVPGPLLAQSSAHGRAHLAALDGSTLRWRQPRRRVAPGQLVVLYDGDEVVGSATVASPPASPPPSTPLPDGDEEAARA